MAFGYPQRQTDRQTDLVFLYLKPRSKSGGGGSTNRHKLRIKHQTRVSWFKATKTPLPLMIEVTEAGTRQDTTYPEFMGDVHFQAACGRGNKSKIEL